MDPTIIMTPFVLVSTVILVICLPRLFRYIVLRYRLRNFKGPRGLPFLGNVLQFGNNNVAYTQFLWRTADAFRENGSYLLYFGLMPVIVVYNAVDIEKILQNVRHDDKGYLYNKCLSPWLGDGLLLSDGSKWKARRKLLTPSFHFSILKKFLIVFNEQAKCLTEQIDQLVDQPSVDLPPLLSLCSLDIMSETIMGLRLGAQKGGSSEYVEAVHRLGKVVLERVRKPWCWVDFVFRRTQLGKRHKECLEILHNTTKQVIRDRKLDIQEEGRNDVVIDDKSRDVRKRRRLAFLDLLIEVQKQDPSLTDEGIQEEVDTFMFEGHDTVSTSLTMAMYLIGIHPEVQKKIQEELEKVFGNDRERHVTYEDLQQLEYLSCVMKESQRFLSTVPIVGRDLAEDTKIGGIDVPKGAHVALGIYSLHRDPNQFPKPDKFDPDRFLPGNSEGQHNFAFIPFSGGHRNCIGQKFAVMEQKVILATLLRRIEIKSLQKIDEMRFATELVLRPVDGVNVTFTRRF